MPGVVLLVAANAGAYAGTSSPLGSGQLDATPGSDYGAIVPCPGVFPAYIKCSSKALGLDTSVEIVSVIAGPEHLLVREKHSRLLPFSGNRVRIVEAAYANRILGGRYTEEYNTPEPVLQPYGGVRNILLNGIPDSILQLENNIAAAHIEGSAQQASDPLNYYEFYNTGFKYPNLISHFNEYGHFLATGTANAQLLSCNFSANPSLVATNTTAGAINPTYNIGLTITPVVVSGQIQNNTSAECAGSQVELGARLPLTSIALVNHTTENRLLPGFSEGNCSELYVLGNTAVGSISTGTASIKRFATYAAQGLAQPVTYLALNNQDRVLGGVLTTANEYHPDLGEYFKFRSVGGDVKTPVVRPPLAYYRGITTLTTVGGDQTKTLWVNTYPVDNERWPTYEDIKATQYGYVLLETLTRRLQFMSSAYHGDLVPAEYQVPSKLIHAPPRSVDWRSAWNMGLGVNPGNIGTDSLYKTAANAAVFAASNHIHGGGGHLIAVGTYNGIAIHDNTVAVWGSNRWGQCIQPAVITNYLLTAGAGIVDVAAAVGPQVLKDGGLVPSLDEELMEYTARNYVDTPGMQGMGDTSVYGVGSYPYTNNPYTAAARYAAHVSYLNLPGHVGVVTANGRVYCWGNNQYNQCEVPAAINLVDSFGVINTTTPTDPVVELALGGYHCVARTRTGAIYVWGAGNSNIAGDASGYVLTAGGSPISSLDNGGPTSRSVHFGQSVFNAAQPSPTTLAALLFAPNSDPPGVSSTDEPATEGTKYLAVTNVTSNGGIIVGQKTNSSFGLSNPTDKLLKGTIAAGAFHTAIIDSQLKIQCIGAGRGSTDEARIYRNYDPVTLFSSPDVISAYAGSAYGTSYTEYAPALPTYPHHCQSMSQYVMPLEPLLFVNSTDAIAPWQVQLARFAGSAFKHRPFQDLTFKKVVCGPYTTHGIVHSIARNGATTFTAAANINSWSFPTAIAATANLSVGPSDAHSSGITGAVTILGQTTTGQVVAINSTIDPELHLRCSSWDTATSATSGYKFSINASTFPTVTAATQFGGSGTFELQFKLGRISQTASRWYKVQYTVNGTSWLNLTAGQLVARDNNGTEYGQNATGWSSSNTITTHFNTGFIGFNNITTTLGTQLLNFAGQAVGSGIRFVVKLTTIAATRTAALAVRLVACYGTTTLPEGTATGYVPTQNSGTTYSTGSFVWLDTVIFSAERQGSPADPYTALEKAEANGRVVSWGRASPTMLGYNKLSTGPTGLGHSSVTSFNPEDNPCMQIAGTGSRDQLVGTYLADSTLLPEALGTPRAFSLLNRGLFTPTGEIAGIVATNDALSNLDANRKPIYYYPSGSPISISKFKVKDVAPGSDFTGYIGYINNLQKSYFLSRPGLVSTPANNSAGSTFDFEASVFFVGDDNYWFPEMFNPYSGFRFVRRNKQGGSATADLRYPGNTALKVKTRSYYYGKIKDTTGAAATVGSATDINYVVPSSLHVSSSGAVVVVNADNRPVAWKAVVPGPAAASISTYIDPTPSLDLSLLPTLPFSGFKTGLGHIVAATTGDWPIAKSLNTLAGVPDIASALGSILSTTTITGPTVPSSILHTTKKSHQPVLVAWGAGDGREYGTSLISGGWNGALTGPDIGGATPWGGTNGSEQAAYGMWYLDTHAITRYDNSVTGNPAGYATTDDAAPGTDTYVGLSDLTGQTAAVNYYGDYRWLMHSDLTAVEVDADLQSLVYSNPGLPLGSHLIEALQAKFSFNPATYPATVTTALTGSPVLNGTAFAKIPQAYGMPWTNFDTVAAELKKCCTTAAEATTTNQRINHLQEYHGPLSLEIQNDYEYITDYDAGATTTAVLFNSSITDYDQVAIDGHLTSSANYVSHFDTPNAGFRFDRRRVNKLAITGYGCEGQTAGPERILKDGTLTPIVPRIFSKSAKVYCGASYTAVTDPIKIHTFTTTIAQSLDFTLNNTKTFDFEVPITKFANRIRGLDVRLTFTASAANADTVPVNFHNWQVNIQYQQNNWSVASTLRRAAGVNTLIKGTNLHDSAITTSTFVFSDRFNPNTAYTYIGTKETYTEAGLMPVPVGSLLTDAAAYNNENFLYPIPPAGTAITATNSRTGCYPACSTNGGASIFNIWNYRDASAAAALLKFDQTPITVVITDGTTTPNYTNLTLNVELVVEVDDGPYPMVVYGRRKAGIWTGAGADGPSYQADYFAFTGNSVTSDVELENSCPCLLDNTLDDLHANTPPLAGRRKPVSYPADNRFICGTRKYGPSGNPEIAANVIHLPASGPSVPVGSSTVKILGDLTANFKSVFSLVRNRPILNDIVTGTMLGPTLYPFPSTAFIVNTTIIDLGAPTAPPALLAKLVTNSLPTYLGLKFQMSRALGQPACRLLSSNPNLGTKGLNVNSPACVLKLTTIPPNLGLKFALFICNT